MKKGLCLANVPGDLHFIDKFKANFIRVSDLNAVAFDKENNGVLDYFVTIGTHEDDALTVAIKIRDLDKQLVVKPIFYAVVNEKNELDFPFVERVREILMPFPSISICKGAHTSCTERAAYKIYQDYFSNRRLFIPEKHHVLHFYLKPYTFWNFFENQKRIMRFKWIVENLKKRGVERIIIGECHDGDMFKKGFPDHGDFVYATKCGVDKIYRLAKDGGCFAACYYHAPFLGYSGNTVLGK